MLNTGRMVHLLRCKVNSDTQYTSIRWSYAVGDWFTIGHAMADNGTYTDEDVTYVTYVIGGATLGISKFDR